VVVDEMASLLLDKQLGATVEGHLVRIATLGRAAGIHLILATQSPRADVITGLIRANVPTRIAFRTVTRMDSMIILDVQGAELLAGSGEFLARLPGHLELVRSRGRYLSTLEIDAIVARARSRVSGAIDGCQPME